MSRGISIYYKLLDEDNHRLIYGYSGADINKIYSKELLLKYDGVIQIFKESLHSKDVLEALKDNDVIIKNECEYEGHHSRVVNGDSTIGFFAMKVIFKIFRVFKNTGHVEQKGAVVF